MAIFALKIIVQTSVGLTTYSGRADAGGSAINHEFRHPCLSLISILTHDVRINKLDSEVARQTKEHDDVYSQHQTSHPL